MFYDRTETETESHLGSPGSHTWPPREMSGEGHGRAKGILRGKAGTEARWAM